jgi:hypothetical protein
MSYVIKQTGESKYRTSDNHLIVYGTKPPAENGFRAVKLTPAIILAAKTVLNGVAINNDYCGLASLPLAWDEFDRSQWSPETPRKEHVDEWSDWKEEEER